MSKLHLVASVPNLGAHKLAWIVGRAASPADALAAFARAAGGNAMLFDRLITGEIVPGSVLAAEIQLWSRGVIDRRDWRRPALRWWFEQPRGIAA